MPEQPPCDADGDDRFDDVKLLKTTGGGVGHGRNALTLGPDNLIDVIHGNNALVSETDRTIPDDSPRRHLAEDRLRPAIWDRFLFDSDAKMPAGLLNWLTEPEILDLLEYLRVGRR